MATVLPSSPPQEQDTHKYLQQSDDDGDTASQRSISLSSTHVSPRNSSTIDDITPHPSSYAVTSLSNAFLKRTSHATTLDTDLSSEADGASLYTHETGPHETPSTSATPSIYEEDTASRGSQRPTYPPIPLHRESSVSLSSFTSTSSRKTRPESLIIPEPTGPLILGIALVDFNHLVGPKMEYYKGDVFENEEVAKILPFLALPDGAHLSSEDYTYFHLVPSDPRPTTVFGISCNQQIAASSLLVRDTDVTRSIVQKAVVVLASKPVFGPIRDKLGVVTTALFLQKDFSDTRILDDFGFQLEMSLRGQLTESGLYMGTRELVHNFRHKTLVLVKALMLQKRIMFYGYPVERLCTYQYSLVSLLPGLLQTLDDCGSPPLAYRAPSLSKPTSLRTSDHKSMMAYTGLPLDIFGKDAFFQPYLPLQQVDMIKETKSWLCGATNTILTQQREIDLLVNTESGIFEFRDPTIERAVALTAADRKWIDEIVTEVNEGWNESDPRKPAGLQFKGSDDYIRSKFEEYISAALATIKYRDFILKGESSGVLISGGTGLASPWEDFNTVWIHEFKSTNAYEVWERVTDPLLFDLVESRHPCNDKPSVVSDIGLRLQEGIQELKIEQQLAPAREVVARTLTVGSANFFKAVEGVRERWAPRPANSGSSSVEDLRSSCSSTPVEVSKADLEDPPLTARASLTQRRSDVSAAPAHPQTPVTARPSLSSWGAGIGSFFSSKLSEASGRRPSSASITSESSSPPRTPAFGSSAKPPSVAPHSPTNSSSSRSSEDKNSLASDQRHPEETAGMAL
ncbi:Transport protein Avl9 domain containing protein [Amanita muscaria]